MASELTGDQSQDAVRTTITGTALQGTGPLPPLPLQASTDGDRLDRIAAILEEILSELRANRQAKAAAVPAIPASNAGLDEIHSAILDMTERLHGGLKAVNARFEEQSAAVRRAAAQAHARRVVIEEERKFALGGAARDPL